MKSSLTQGQQDTCIYTGIFGALLSATCLVQHMIIMRFHWITFTLLAFYVFAIISFSMLAMLKPDAPLMLAISGGLTLVGIATLTISNVFSVVVLLLFIYTMAVVAIVYFGGYVALMKADAAAKRADELSWQEKIG